MMPKLPLSPVKSRQEWLRMQCWLSLVHGTVLDEMAAALPQQDFQEMLDEVHWSLF